ncbi:MAG: dephospho-CoA kinase [Bacteroidales bacterium]
MIKLGLTGGYGSGKSTIAKAIEAMGFPVFYADQRAKQLYKRKDVKAQIRGVLGDHVFDDHGHIDKKKLASTVFYDAQKLTRVNAILHPKVAEDFEQWLEQQSHKLVFHEAALLFEAGFQAKFDYVVTVSAPEELCVERVVRRDGVSREQVMQRMKYQYSDQKKRELADFIIENDQRSMVLPQLLELIEEWEVFGNA